jgi:hypothetical protein
MIGRSSCESYSGDFTASRQRYKPAAPGMRPPPTLKRLVFLPADPRQDEQPRRTFFSTQLAGGATDANRRKQVGNAGCGVAASSASIGGDDAHSEGHLENCQRSGRHRARETPVIRILARFPDFNAALSQSAAVQLPVESAVVEPAGSDESRSPRLARKPLASQLESLLMPRRRGLRQIRAGWGSIGFLAVLAAAIWSVAWWQDHQHSEDDHAVAVPQVAVTPLEVTEQVVR